MTEQTLAQKLDAMAEFGQLDLPIPPAITDNLARVINLRPYQDTAIQRFLFYMEWNQRRRPAHLLFHMATGSGKTVIMAALILQLYARGHRNFLFFVNSTQIVEKTKANFLDPASSKYLFADPLRFDGKPVRIREVANFDEADADSINIHFTTIQGLHSRMVNPRENAVSVEDFAQRDLVLISDEAHHLNAETKAKPNQGELELRNSWESTVDTIFRANPKNLLLEFTATANLSHPALAAKYHDKLLYDYSLRQFRADRYSKEIELRRADFALEDRMLQAAVLSQFRRKLAGANGLSLKPIILMKSRRIADSAENEAAFNALIEELDGPALAAMQDALEEGDPVEGALQHMLADPDVLSADDLAREMRLDFSPSKVRNVNSKDDLEKQQIELNRLEDRDNAVRCIFAVDKLNEGWDVLNLFDIVRLYDAGTNATTNQEAQLIGRGARYWPFTLADRPDEPRAQRKLDAEMENPLRLIETLHYHCTHDPKYVAQIKEALVESGLMEPDDRRVTVKVKDSFRQLDFFRDGKVFKNERRPNPRSSIFRLEDYSVRPQINIEIGTSGRVTTGGAFGGEVETASAGVETKSREMRFADLGRPVVRHALDARPFFHFASLRKQFPRLKSRDAFIDDADFFGGVRLDVRGPVALVDAPDAATQLRIAGEALDRIEAGIAAHSHDHVGTREFKPHAMAELVDDTTLSVGGAFRKHWSEHDDTLDIQNLDWFAQDDFYGTSEEVRLIRFVKDRIVEWREQHGAVRLIRNEKAVKLYAFEDGAGFEPDFLLYLERDWDGEPATVQIFLEPKGGHLLAKDDWKSHFLEAIERQAVLPDMGGKTYVVKGLPLFNENDWPTARRFRDAASGYRHG